MKKPPSARNLRPALSATPPSLLAARTLERVLSAALERGGDFAEVFVERTSNTGIVLEERRVKSAQAGLVQGAGVRVIYGSQVGYAYSDDLDDEALLRAADNASLIARGTGSAPHRPLGRVPSPSYYRVAPPLTEVDVDQKVALVVRAERAARGFDARVKQVTAMFADQTKRICIANSNGLFAEDTQDLCRLTVQVVAEAKRQRRTGYQGSGGRVPFTHFELHPPEEVGREAARQAVATLGGVEALAGPQTVVLAPGWSGILLHEAVGHGLEADFIRKGTSLFAGKLGEKVASELVTVIDDGTVANARGSVNVDDEGTPGAFKVLIEKGILRGYMFDALNAKLMGERSTGSGRRESFQHPPLPRMTNTYLAPGDSTPEEIIRSVDKGLYCAQFGGGQVDITNGNFVFEVNEAYEIVGGRLGRPVKGATLIGVGPEALKQVTRVGCDPRPDPGMGTCGKSGQSVPVGVGLPTVRIDNMTVGGTRVSR